MNDHLSATAQVSKNAVRKSAAKILKTRSDLEMLKTLKNVLFANRDRGMVSILLLTFGPATLASVIANKIDGFDAAAATWIVVLLVACLVAWIIAALVVNSDMPDDSKTLQNICQAYGVEPSQVLLINDGAIIYKADGDEERIDATRFEENK